MVNVMYIHYAGLREFPPHGNMSHLGLYIMKRHSNAFVHYVAKVVDKITYFVNNHYIEFKFKFGQHCARSNVMLSQPCWRTHSSFVINYFLWIRNEGLRL